MRKTDVRASIRNGDWSQRPTSIRAATTNIEFTHEGRKGRQSQTWIRMPEGWRIVAAHVRFMHESG